MNQDKSLSFTLKVIFGLAAAGLVLYFMQQAADFIVQILLAWVIVLSASPLFYWLQSKNVPGWLTMILTIIAIIAVFGTLVLVLIVASERLVELLTDYGPELTGLRESITDFISGLGISQLNAEDAADAIDPGKLMNFYAGLISAAAAVLGDIIFIAMIIFFSLAEAFNMPAKIAAELELGNDYVRRLADFAADIRSYVSITTWVGLLTGAVDTIFFILMGVPLALLWGLVAFLLSYVPVVGFWLAAIPPTILVLLKSGPLAAVIVFAGIVLINAFFDEIFKPRMLGAGLDLAPVMVILSLAIWTAVLGPVGSILSVPVTMIFKELVLEADDQNRWIARLMGKGPEKEPPDAGEDQRLPVA